MNIQNNNKEELMGQELDEMIVKIDKKIVEVEQEQLKGLSEEEQIALKEKWKKDDEEFKNMLEEVRKAKRSKDK